MNLGEVCTAEPAGFGAVVLTSDGTWWTRCNHPSTCDGGGREERWEKSSNATRFRWAEVAEAGEPILCNRGVNIPPVLPPPRPKAEVEPLSWKALNQKMATVSTSLSNLGYVASGNYATATGGASSSMYIPPANADWDIVAIDIAGDDAEVDDHPF